MAKALVPVWLIAAVVSGGQGDKAALVVAALAFALVGDVALLPRFDRFMLGLASFLIAHVVFIGAFASADPQLTVWGGVAIAVVLAGMGSATRRIVGAVSTGSESRTWLREAVALYVAILAAMVAAAILTGDALATAGAAVFAMSDGVLGWNRFVVRLDHGRLKTHVLYHIALCLLASWVAF